MHMRTLTTTGLLVLCTLSGVFIFTSRPALAGIGHKYLSQIAEVPANPAEPGLVSGPFAQLAGLTTDSNNLYVLDAGNATVDEFNAANEFGEQISGAGVFPFPSSRGTSVAVNEATHDIYVDYQGSKEGRSIDLVGVLSATGESLAIWTGEDSPSKTFGSAYSFVAADNSTDPSDPAAGNVYVTDSEDGGVDVLRPDASGQERYVTRFTGVNTPNGFFYPGGVSVDDETGDVAVTDVENNGVVDVFRPRTVDEYEFLFQLTGPPGGVFKHGAASSSVAIYSSDGDIYVADDGAGVAGNEAVVYQFSSSGSYLGQVTGTPSGSFGELTGLAVGAAGDLYVAEKNAVNVFAPNSPAPGAITEASSNLRGGSVTLNGTVDPSGVEVTVCEFEYGTTGSYGSTAPCDPAPGSGTSPVPVSANLTGLTPGTTYHDRLVVTYADGTVRGLDDSFTTPVPKVFVGRPSSVRSASAILTGTVENPHEVDIAACQFEYGTVSFGEFTAPCAPGPGLAGGAVAAEITGLAFDSAYRYRLAITLAGGETLYSTEENLATPPLVAGSALASGITSFAATLTGVIEAGQVTPTYRFVYGLTSAYGFSIPQPDALTGTGGQQTVAQTLTSLQPNTTYHFALVATNFGGGESVGPDETFTTRPLVPPAVATGGSEGIGQTTATLTGSVNPEGIPTTYRFEYGMSAGYGSSWPLSQVFASDGSVSESVAIAVPNLQPGVVYHYRLVASNEDGVAYGADQSFATPAYPVSIIQEPSVLAPLKAVGKPSKPPAKRHRIRKSKTKKKKTNKHAKGTTKAKSKKTNKHHKRTSKRK